MILAALLIELEPKIKPFEVGRKRHRLTKKRFDEEGGVRVGE